MSNAEFGLGEIDMERNLADVCGIASAGDGWLDSCVSIFHHLQCWIDPVDRHGPHAMAVDEWLCGVADSPILRVYRWRGDWCSVGYFGEIQAARARIDCINWVRRITGGGVVDHRNDWTYSLIIPKEEAVANWRGDASYRAIHEALAGALRLEGIDCRLSSSESVPGETLCFSNPVDHDLVDAQGTKLAGAGQRRSRHGLLHQGSVAISAQDEASHVRAWAMAGALAEGYQLWDAQPDPQVIEKIVRSRYGCDAWLQRR